MNFKIEKEQVIEFGKKAGQLSKVVVMEGVKAVLLKAAVKTITTSFDEGLGGVKKLDFEEVVGIKTEDKPKRKLFSKKKETEELIEEILEEAESLKDDVKGEVFEGEVLDKK